MNNLIALPPETQLDYILVDGSGSMQPHWYNFLAAADILIDAVRASTIQSHLIAHVFDSADLEMIQRDGPLAQCATFRDQPLSSHFQATPLYDAINCMCIRLRALDPQKCSIIIVTDGMDTKSYTYITQAKALLDWCRAKGWQVTFIGCDWNNFEQARELGADDTNCIGTSSKRLTEAARLLAGKRLSYGHSDDPIEFSNSERESFGGYLPPPASPE